MDDGPEMDTKQQQHQEQPEHFVGNFSILNCCSYTFTGILPRPMPSFTDIYSSVPGLEIYPPTAALLSVELSREME